MNFGFSPDKDDFERTCLVIRIRDGSSMIPLSKKFKWGTIWRYIIENTSSSVKLKHYVRYILLVYPTNEGDILFGFRVEFNNLRYSKIESSQTCKVENIFIERIDYQYLTMRGGTTSALKDKRVLLLGCGLVGGYIADNLCQAGVINVDILDNDIFQPENVHRHWLGFDSISPKQYRYKADLVKEKLEDAKNAVLTALKTGYRLIDTAQGYMNEPAVGEAIKESGISREEIFATSKLWIQDFSYKGAKEATQRTLDRKVSATFQPRQLNIESLG